MPEAGPAGPVPPMRRQTPSARRWYTATCCNPRSWNARSSSMTAAPDGIGPLLVRLVNLIINRAMTLRASDIHIEPFENRLKVRYRIDGVLQEGEAPPVHSAAAVVSRIKIMAKLNIAERRLPQDGRIQVKAQGKPVDMRVSTVPTLCRDCREPDTPSPAQLDELQRWAAAEDSSAPGHDLLAVLNNDVSPGQYRRAGELVFYRANGCKTCSYTGYHGRTVISELLVLSESVRRLILSRADAREIQRAALNAGMDSMKIDRLRKALQGVTTIEEVARVTQG